MPLSILAPSPEPVPPVAAPAMLSVLIPVYNEARWVERVLSRIQAAPFEKEIIVVDDGSTDGTGPLLRELALAHPLRVVTHRRNAGKGQAVRSAVAACTGDVVVIQDGDLEYDPADYPALLAPLLEGRAQVVFGSRWLGAARALPWWRRFGNRLITGAVNCGFGARLTDVQTGYKALRREVIQDMRLQARGFSFDVELTCKLLRQGVRIHEVPVSYAPRSYADGKKVMWWDGLKALWVILCCRVNPRY